MKLRPAALQDLPILNTISIRSKSHWGYPKEWMDRWLDDLTLDEAKFMNQHILILEIKDQLIGFCSITEDASHYEILHLWVLPEHIGQGYGKKLLNATIQQFVKQAKPILVTADPNAEPFYQSQGFETFDQVESYPAGRFLPIMKKVYP